MTGPRPTSGHLVVCLDFDGTLHRYSRGWADGEIYDPPVPGTAAALADMAARGWTPVVCSSRTPPGDIRAWLARQGLPDLAVTNVKPAAVAYVDDRAVTFEGDWPAALAAVDRLIRRGPWTRGMGER